MNVTRSFYLTAHKLETMACQNMYCEFNSVEVLDIYFIDKGALIIGEVLLADKGPLIQRF